MEEENWEILLRRIKAGECTPFLGAGACAGVLPLARDLAHDLARESKYPLAGSDDLVRVTQFIAVRSSDGIYPKELIRERFQKFEHPDFGNPDEPHGLLADLPLPIYITTNYDNFLVKALESRNRNAKRELCRWNERVRDQPSVFDSDFVPSVAEPVIFHLHGHTEVLTSMVVTEDDYIDFLISISQNPELLPLPIQAALAKTSLLFLGYGLADWSFLVLFRSLVSYLKRSSAVSHVSVQLLPMGSNTISEEQKRQVQRYFDRHFQKLEINVYWGKCREFAHELRTRWEDLKNG